ncbi:protein argonaute-4-like [Tetranychus urticae]|uniref:protein argonaute-4-like n=1 Tax=Tetranychus urticae TaxID=32264 RepID=UPI00077BAA5B|nr:protein argonaute-4-like [Tetranychus urticae]XP_015795442.1 protein argonaute-4-like [Tetranychus urticae]
MSSRPYNSRGRGRGYNGNSAGRRYDGNTGYRGGSRQGGDHNRRRNMVDNNLINSQNVQWDYEESQIGLAVPEFVKRKGYLSEKFGRKIKLMTNHFSFEYSSDVQIYHYDFSWLSYGTYGEEPKEQKLNSYERYKLFDAVRAQYPQYFTSSSVGYDGKANVYLPYELESELSDLPVRDVELEGIDRKNFIVNFNGGKVISLASIEEYYAGSNTDVIRRESLQDAIQALHIILKFPSRYSMIPLGRLAMFPINAERYYLSNWMELALGHRKSLRFSEIGLTLVVDRASAAFLKSGNGLDFVKSIIDLRGGSLSNFKPSPVHMEALRRAFAHVKISTGHLKSPKKYVVKDIAERAANRDTFPLNEDGIEREITVADYFREKYKIVLEYPNLPCLITSNNSKIPIEVCKIEPNQSSQSIKRSLSAQEKAEMIKLTATEPDERFTCLLQAHAQIRRLVDEDLKDFMLDINVSPIGVEGIVLNAPRLAYYGEELTPKDGAWNLQGKSFFKRITFDNFGVLNFCASQQEGIPFCKAFTEKAYEMGMTPRPDKAPLLKSITNYMEKTQKELDNIIMDTLTVMKNKQCAFALCIFPDIKDIRHKNKAIYNLTKRIADTKLNFPTQGVTLESVQRCSAQTIANILAKVNKKLGGVNVILKESIKPPLLQFKKNNKIMIIGADVTHPGTGDELQSSVAASVSTYDANHTMFYPSVRVQHKKDARDGKRIVEVIKDFKSMVQEHLKNFFKVNGSFPDTILYLRDGVSDGQYRQILNEEVIHLKNPFGNKYKPKVTAVVISKRILTRTRPIDPEDAVMKNVPPGTTIDRIITHPSDFDYFQYGHKGIKGTSRPCHYYMLHDDNNLTIDEMSKISYYLCHIFERSTSSTSAPAPVMHAHNLAFKVRQWICSKDVKYNLRSLKLEERFEAEEKIARELNSEFSNINADYARSSMFYI